MTFTRITVFCLIASFPTGCVVVEPPPPAMSTPAQQFQQIEIHVVTQGGEPSRTVVQTPPPTSVHCKPFQLPVSGTVPQLDLTDAKYQTFEDIEAALAEHIKALRRHITTERQRLETAHKAHLKECGS